MLRRGYVQFGCSIFLWMVTIASVCNAGPSFEFNNCDSVSQTEWEMDFEVQLAKRIQQRRIYGGYHDLFRSTYLDTLARNHSAFMEQQGVLSDTDIAKRRAQIIAQGYAWFRAEDLTKDPKYPPLAITGIDEMYANGSTPRHMWIDWFAKYHHLISPFTRFWHQWIGVGVVCTTNPTTGDSFYWGTIILVGVCHPHTKIPPPFYSDFMCCDLPSPANECFLPHHAAFFYTFDNSTQRVAPTCCSIGLHLRGEYEVPPQNTTRNGTLVMQLPSGTEQDKELCYCLEHDIPTHQVLIGGELYPNVSDLVTSGGFHYGGYGQQTESLVIHAVPGDPVNNTVRECWAYEEEGLCLNGLYTGKYYLDLHTNGTDSDPTPPQHGLIRTQLWCLGYLLDFEGILVEQDPWTNP